MSMIFLHPNGPSQHLGMISYQLRGQPMQPLQYLICNSSYMEELPQEIKVSSKISSTFWILEKSNYHVNTVLFGALLKSPIKIAPLDNDTVTQWSSTSLTSLFLVEIQETKQKMMSGCLTFSKDLLLGKNTNFQIK